VLQCAAVRYQYVVNFFAVCCSVLLCVEVRLALVEAPDEMSQKSECCSVLQCVAVRCSVLQCVAVCCSVLQCVVAVCGSVLQCAALR